MSPLLPIRSAAVTVSVCWPSAGGSSVNDSAQSTGTPSSAQVNVPGSLSAIVTAVVWSAALPGDDRDSGGRGGRVDGERGFGGRRDVVHHVTRDDGDGVRAVGEAGRGERRRAGRGRGAVDAAGVGRGRVVGGELDQRAARGRRGRRHGDDRRGQVLRPEVEAERERLAGRAEPVLARVQPGTAGGRLDAEQPRGGRLGRQVDDVAARIQSQRPGERDGRQARVGRKVDGRARQRRGLVGRLRRRAGVDDRQDRELRGAVGPEGRERERVQVAAAGADRELLPESALAARDRRQAVGRAGRRSGRRSRCEGEQAQYQRE